MPSGFRMGSSGSYITYSGSTVTLKSGTTSNLDDSAGNADGGGTTPNSRDVNSEIILNSGSTGLSIKGIPSLGNYTKYAGGGLYTNVEANDNNSFVKISCSFYLNRSIGYLLQRILNTLSQYRCLYSFAFIIFD